MYHPAVTHVERQCVGTQWMADDGSLFGSEDDAALYAFSNGMAYSAVPKYQDLTVTDSAAWTETIHHDAVYGWL